MGFPIVSPSPPAKSSAMIAISSVPNTAAQTSDVPADSSSDRTLPVATRSAGRAVSSAVANGFSEALPGSGMPGA